MTTLVFAPEDIVTETAAVVFTRSDAEVEPKPAPADRGQRWTVRQHRGHLWRRPRPTTSQGALKSRDGKGVTRRLVEPGVATRPRNLADLLAVD